MYLKSPRRRREKCSEIDLESVVVYLKLPRRRREYIIVNWFEKYRCVPKIASPKATTCFQIVNWFGKYRCVPKNASPKARTIINCKYYSCIIVLCDPMFSLFSLFCAVLYCVSLLWFYCILFDFWGLLWGSPQEPLKGGKFRQRRTGGKIKNLVNNCKSFQKHLIVNCFD